MSEHRSRPTNILDIRSILIGAVALVAIVILIAALSACGPEEKQGQAIPEQPVTTEPAQPVTKAPPTTTTKPATKAPKSKSGNDNDNTFTLPSGGTKRENFLSALNGYITVGNPDAAVKVATLTCEGIRSNSFTAEDAVGAGMENDYTAEEAAAVVMYSVHYYCPDLMGKVERSVGGFN